MLRGAFEPHPVRGVASAVLTVALLGGFGPPTSSRHAAAAETDSEVASLRGQVLDRAGKPVAGATVRVLSQGLSSSRRDMLVETWTDPIVVVTDADGRFALADLPGSSFVVRVEAPGHAPTTTEHVLPGTALDLNLRAGQQLRGRVIDFGSGQPVAAATVLACDGTSFLFGREACARVLTDEDGTFVSSGLPTGDVQFRAHAPGRAVSPVRVVELPLARDASPFTFSLRPGARVSGRVVDEGRRPVAGARVYLRPLAGAAAEQADGEIVWPVHSDDEGAFVLEGVRAGERFGLFAHRADRGSTRGGKLAVEPGLDVEGFEILLPSPAKVALRLVDENEEVVQDFDLYFRESGERPGRWQGPLPADRIEHEDGDRRIAAFTTSGTFDLLIAPQDFAEMERGAIVLAPGRTVDLGTLIATEGLSLSGRVRDTDGDPIVRATVEATWSDVLAPRSRRGLSDTEGRFRLSGLEEAQVRVEASADGFVPAVLSETAPGRSDVDLTLRRVGGLSGRVELEDGSTPDAFLIVTHVEAESGSTSADRYADFPRKETFTGTDGAYRIDGLPAGHYTIEARASGHAPGRRGDLRVSDGEITQVALLELERGLAVQGRVLARADDAPVQAAVIEAHKEGGSLIAPSSDPKQVATSDADGLFRLEGLEAGPLVVQARHPEFAPTEERRQVTEEAQEEEIVLRLSRGGALTGTVRDAAGEPSPRRTVVVTQDLVDQNDYEYATTDVDGRYELTRLAPGSYVAGLLPAPGGAVRADFKNVVIRDGEGTVLDFDEAARITLEGTVYQDGEPLRGGLLFFAQRLSLTDFRFATTDEAGRFQVGLDAPGRYRVMIQSGPSGASGGASTEITLPDRALVRQDIHLGGDGLAGTVTDAEGQPLAGAVVSALAEGAEVGAQAAFLVAETGPDGRYRIQALPEGVYRVTATAPGFRSEAVYPVSSPPDGGVIGLDFRLERGNPLRGRLVDDRGGGISGAAVLAAPAGTLDPWGTGAATAVTDVNGAFQLTAPADGPLDLTALPGGWAPVRVVGVVPPDDDELWLQARPGGSLRLQIVGPGGAPLRGVPATVRPLPPFLGSELGQLLTPPVGTDAAGNVVFQHLAAGTYEIVLPGLDPAATAPVTVLEGSESLVRVEVP